MPRNLFTSLFQFHPREGHTPYENFLTESVAYVLETEPEVLRRWLSRFVESNEQISQVSISTRERCPIPDQNTVVFPDLVVTARLGDQRAKWLFEHKWDAGVTREQLSAYARIVEGSRKGGSTAELFFVGATQGQANEARATGVKACRLWRDFVEVLDQANVTSPVACDLRAFLVEQGLGAVNVLTVARLQALRLKFNDSLRNVKDHGDMMHYLSRLSSEYSWDSIPERMREEPPVVTDRYGRVGLEFATPLWTPCLSFGIMYSNRDHGVDFVSADGADLIMRMECEPSLQPLDRSLVELLVGKAAEFIQNGTKARTYRDRDNTNPHTIFITQADLNPIVANHRSEDAQVDAIRQTFHSWSDRLFADGHLEAALRTGFKW